MLYDEPFGQSSQMKLSKEQVIELIYECVDEANEMISSDRQIQKSPDAALLKGGEGLDSLGFVNFISLLEEKYSRRFGESVVLIPKQGKKGAKDPFESIATLAEFVISLAGLDGCTA